MIEQKKINIIVLFWFLSLVFCFLFSFPFVSITSLESIENKKIDSNAPLGIGKFLLKATIYRMPWNKKFFIRANDCVLSIKINSKEEILSDGCGKCLDISGLDVNLNNWEYHFKQGVEIKFETIEGPGWIDVKLCKKTFFVLIIMFFSGLFGTFLMKKYNAEILYIFLISVLCSGLYLINTNPHVMQHDFSMHVNYIMHLMNNGLRLPELNAGTYHTPFYYFTIASIFLIIENIKSLNYETLILGFQIISYLVYILSSLIYCAIFSNIRKKENISLFCLFLLLLTPGCLFFSARINNDVFLPLLGGLIFYFLIKFKENNSLLYVFCGGLCSALVFMTKFSGIATGAAYVFLIFLFTDKKNKYRLLLTSLCSTVAFFCCVLYWLIRNFILTGHFVYSGAMSITDNQGLYVPNSLAKYLSFDFISFIQAHSAYETSIRKSLHTYFALTFLHSEFNVPINQNLFTFINISFLFFIIFIIYSFYYTINNKNNYLVLSSFVFIFFQYLFFIYFNIKKPFSCHQDFRFMAPVFLNIFVLLGLGINDILNNKNKIIKNILYFMLCLLPISLYFFYINLFFSYN